MVRVQTVENVIVTVCVGEKRLDMELPAFLNVRELTAKIDETLRSMPGQLTPGLRCAGLTCRGERLGPEDTLARRGIWDGSEVACILREEAAT